ncbi:MAG: hypothetical protein AABZ12_03940 [Planctomycetota bacterium]
MAIAWAGSARAADDPAFLEEFDQPRLSSGWTIIREDASAYTLAARSGFFRILTQRGLLGIEGTARNLLVREVSGDFILDARLEFNPQDAQQYGGLLVYVDDEHAVSVGLVHASGRRGEFRGIVLLNIGGDANTSGTRPGARYDESNTDSPDVVYLRLLRFGDQFVGAYSSDGQTFSDIGTVVNALPDNVRVGIGAVNGGTADCGAECDISTPADFDFVRITSLSNGEGGDPTAGVVLESVSLDGPDGVVAGLAARFQAVAHFSNGETADVSDQAEWTAAPPTVGSIENGRWSVGAVDAARRATVVATYTHLTSSGAVTRTGSKVVLINTSGSPFAALQLCGAGIGAFLGLIVVPMWSWRHRPKRQGYESAVRRRTNRR